MLVGRHPVAGKTVRELHHNHSSGNLRPLPAILPQVVLDLTARCLALNPGERYQTWEEVEKAIALAYQGTIKYPVPAPEPEDAPTPSERMLEGWFLNSIGCSAIKTSSIETSIKCLELALKAGRAEGDQALVGTAICSLGETFCSRGDTRACPQLPSASANDLRRDWRPIHKRLCVEWHGGRQPKIG